MALKFNSNKGAQAMQDETPYKVQTQGGLILARFFGDGDAKNFAKKKAQDTGLNWYRIDTWTFVVTE